MNLSEWNFKPIRVPLVLFAIALAVGTVMVMGAESFWSDIDKDFVREQRTLRASQGRYRTVDDEKVVIGDFLPRYEILRDAGIVGEERRLQWVETLRRVANELRLPELTYTLGSRQLLTPVFATPPGSYQAHASEMTLKMGLLHEIDLLRLMHALDREAEGMFDVSDCTIELGSGYDDLDSPDESFDTDGAKITANCTLQWLTLTAPTPGDSGGV